MIIITGGINKTKSFISKKVTLITKSGYCVLGIVRLKYNNIFEQCMYFIPIM